MLCVCVELHSWSEGEKREGGTVCAVHAYMKAVCADVVSGIGPSHSAVCVGSHVCIVCIVCVRACTYWEHMLYLATGWTWGHGAAGALYLWGWDKRSSEVHRIHLPPTAALHGPCSSPSLAHPPTQGSDRLDLAVVFPTQWSQRDEVGNE